MEEGDRTVPSSSLPIQRPGRGKKSSGLKSTGLQRTSNALNDDRSIGSRDVERLNPVIARKTTKKREELVQSVLSGQGTRPFTGDTSRDHDRRIDTVVGPSATASRHAGSSERINDIGFEGQPQLLISSVRAPGIALKGLSNPLPRTNNTGVVGHVNLDESRTTRAAERETQPTQGVRRTAFENVARKSGLSASTLSRNQPVPLAEGARTFAKSVGQPLRAHSMAWSSENIQEPSTFRFDFTHKSELSQARKTFAPSIQAAGRAQPNRKTIQAPSQSLSAGQRTTMITPASLSIKSGPIIPHWQAVDDEYAKEQGNKHHANRDEREFIKRIGTATTRTMMAQLMTRPGRGKRQKSYVGRNLTVRQVGEADDDNSDLAPSMEIVEDPPPPRRPQQTGFKAARKREWPPQRPVDSDSSEEPAISSSDSTSTVSDEDLLVDEDDDFDSDIEEIVITARREFDPAEIEILPGPPRAPSPLSVNLKMMEAINALSLSSIRMQETKQLPFLLRNLRRGFTGRCRQLGLRTKPTPSEIARLRVRYEYASESFRVRLRDWACPLCELHGYFATREMLACHLAWDHESVRTQWMQLQSGAWSLRLTIPDPPAKEDISPSTLEEQFSRQNTPQRQGHQTEVSSPFPFVVLSPPAPQPLSSDHSHSGETSPLPRKLLWLPAPLSSRDSLATASATPVPSSTYRDRSTTATTTTTTTTTATATTTSFRTRDPRYPTPPPPSDPLGPAAQPPYLPAKSEYGGPNISYSCRPGGACLFDLLNTLPLEPYGVLAWDVLDREDEIYDSDNVKDEYKVMHALWGRWIMLNRNKFIKDYVKGTKAFVDFYWKMIHRAAGWDALRYWLLLLVVDRFITGADVANILKHYESLTGMDSWYD